MTLRAISISSAVLALAAAVAALLVAVPYGAHGAAETGGLVLVCGSVGLAAAHVARLARRRFGGLRRQFLFAAAIALGTTLLAVLIGANRMFVSDHDAALVAALMVGTGLVSVRVGQLLSAGVARDVSAIRTGLEAVGKGARDVQIECGGRDELSELATAVEEMIERLSAEERRRATTDLARRDLVAAVSHDLRTPLASLRLLTDAVGDGLVEGETRSRYLAQMQTHIRALAGLIDDLFELSRLEAGDIEWSMEQVELSELVDETIAAMRPQAQARGVEVDAEIPVELPTMNGDPARLQRVLFNLIQNAIEHTPADGSVVVRAECAPEAIEIEVADTGEGISPADRADVFEPFTRGGVDKSRSTAGAGLGLAIARAIVEGHGGRIWLLDCDAGARVRFSLPVASGRALSLVTNS